MDMGTWFAFMVVLILWILFVDSMRKRFKGKDKPGPYRNNETPTPITKWTPPEEKTEFELSDVEYNYYMQQEEKMKQIAENRRLGKDDDDD